MAEGFAGVDEPGVSGGGDLGAVFLEVGGELVGE